MYILLDVDCGNPSRIQNGKVTLATNATYYGATALYECEEHWQLDGVSRRLCQDDGTWSSEAPVCKGTYICLLSYYKNIDFGTFYRQIFTFS